MAGNFTFLSAISALLCASAFCYSVKIKPSPCRRENEVEYICKPECKNTCKNFNNTYAQCHPRCVPGCFCKPGLIKRERDGKCVPPKECDHVPCPNENEIEYTCKPDCKNTCRNFKNRNAICSAICVPGCFCRPGLLKREIDGKCVKPETCSHAPCIDENEVQYFCMPDCKNTCRNINNPNTLCRTWCKLGCFCRPGLVKRETDGKCVHPDQCSHAPCANNEVEYICKPFCKNTCQNYNNPNAICPAVCTQGCFCKPGLVKRERDGQCVLPEHCSRAPCANKNEVEYICKPSCKNTCRNYNNPNVICPAVCVQGCFCKPGLVKRERDGQCVLPGQCSSAPCADKKEIKYFCKPFCKNTCQNYNNPNAVCPAVCIPGCFCKHGLVKRERDGQCVLPQQCRPAAMCPPGEEFHSCVPTCNHTCRNYRQNWPCPELCSSGCFCRRGLIVNSRGRCVRPQDCKNDLCRKDEEYYNCAPICNTCTNYWQGGPCRKICKIGCFCKRGLVLRGDGRCVFPEQCPRRRPQLPPGHRLWKSTLRPTYRRFDRNFNDSSDATDPFDPKDTEYPLDPQVSPAEEGNLPNTEEHLLKNQNRTCRENEEYYTCMPICNLCANYPTPTVACATACWEGCFCRIGFLKTADDRCVPPEECHQVYPRNFYPWPADDFESPSDPFYDDSPEEIFD